MRAILEKWIKKSFKWNNQIMDTVSFIDVYRIKGETALHEELKSWRKNNPKWLRDFRIVGGLSESYTDNKIIFTTRGDSDSAYGSAYTITQIQVESKDGPKDESKNLFSSDLVTLDFDLRINSAFIILTFNSLLAKYKKNLEILRSKGFDNLNNSSSKVLNKPSNIQNLKRLVILIARLEHE